MRSINAFITAFCSVFIVSQITAVSLATAADQAQQEISEKTKTLNAINFTIGKIMLVAASIFDDIEKATVEFGPETDLSQGHYVGVAALEPSLDQKVQGQPPVEMKVNYVLDMTHSLNSTRVQASAQGQTNATLEQLLLLADKKVSPNCHRIKAQASKRKTNNKRIQKIRAQRLAERSQMFQMCQSLSQMDWSQIHQGDKEYVLESVEGLLLKWKQQILTMADNPLNGLSAKEKAKLRKVLKKGIVIRRALVSEIAQEISSEIVSAPKVMAIQVDVKSEDIFQQIQKIFPYYSKRLPVSVTSFSLSVRDRGVDFVVEADGLLKGNKHKMLSLASAMLPTLADPDLGDAVKAIVTKKTLEIIRKKGVKGLAGIGVSIVGEMAKIKTKRQYNNLKEGMSSLKDNVGSWLKGPEEEEGQEDTESFEEETSDLDASVDDDLL